MHYNITNTNSAIIEIAKFSNSATSEYHLIIKPKQQNSFNDQLNSILDGYSEFSKNQELTSTNTVTFLRFFISDYANQLEIETILNAHPCGKSKNLSLSIVQQPPLSGNKIEAWFHVIVDSTGSSVIQQQNNELLLQRNHYLHVWNTQLITNNGSHESDKQTENIFTRFNHNLESKGLTLKDNCIRTWLFVKDVDFNYKGVVEARRTFFETVGLTKDTNYITSTGIEGRIHSPNINVLMDAYSVGGIKKEQIKFLTAPNHLNPTIDYGVTFERGTSIDYGDRRHIFISGTASIDNQGEVVHVGLIEKQAYRAIENIEALLADADASLNDVAHLIVYLRDVSDYTIIQKFFNENYAHLPKVIVLAPVCRPTWLIEMECIAIKKLKNSVYADF